MTATCADAALLFQDRHTGANGAQTVYRFEADTAPAVSMIEQSRARKEAVVWATRYYAISGLAIANVQERMMPTHFWLIALSASKQGNSETYYAIVLPNGSVVEPTVSHRATTTPKTDEIDVTKDTELKAPTRGLEVHGEIDFLYGWGKGLRSNGPYARSPLWDSPAQPFHPVP